MIKESQKVISLNCGNGILEMNLPQEVGQQLIIKKKILKMPLIMRKL